MCCFSQKHDSEDDLDWWSKYYASTGDLAKSGNYLEKGYDKIKVTMNSNYLALGARFGSGYIMQCWIQA
jgi:hypothetical protein